MRFDEKRGANSCPGDDKSPLSKVAAVKQERRKVADLKPAEYNPRKRLQPGDEEYERLKRSIETFGYVDPIIVNADGTVIGGHQRLYVLQELGYSEADVAVVDLSKQDEKALNIALNKISGEWDEEKLAAIFSDLDVEGYDLNLTGFSDSELTQIFSGLDVGSVEEQDAEPPEGQVVDFENLAELTDGEEDGYAEFEAKFKPKKTTDDCYTPSNVYETIKDWAMEEYGIGGDRPIIRPFYPGGDYEKREYPSGCVVIDNPPFSILSKILEFYNEKGIDYFLFAPTLTLFSGDKPKCRYIINYCGIVYENGANVNTSFVTNLDEYKIRISPELSRRIKETQWASGSDLPKYDYPLNVVTAARLTKLARGGVELKIRPEQCAFIRELDAQKEAGSTLYGSGFLISDGAAEERARAEARAGDAIVWHLSDRERGIVEALNKYDE